MNQVIKAPVQEPASYERMHKMAKELLTTGFFPKEVNTPEKAVAIAMTGKELGLGFMESFRSINVIQGKPSMSAQLLLGLCRRTGEVESSHIEKESDTEAVFVLKRKGSPAYRSVFTIDDAKKLQLSGRDNYLKQPKTMLMWRAISKACRFVFPDAMGGIYTPEEVAAGVDVAENQTGEVEVVEVHPTQTPSEAKAIEDKAEAQIDADDFQTLGQTVIPFGKYSGMTLLKISEEKTEKGGPKGLKYLEWLTLQESRTDDGAKLKVQIAAFLKHFQNN